MIYKKICSSVLVAAMFIVLTGCGKSKTVEENTLTKVKEVKVEAVKSKSVDNISELSGTLQPIEEVTVSFEVSGKINSLSVHEGDNVDVNDILATVDSQNYELQVRQSKSNVEKASEAFSQIEKGAREQEIEQVKLKLQQAKTVYNQAEIDFKRSETLFQEGAITQSDYEKSQNNMTITENNMEAAKQAYSLISEGATEEQKNQAKSSYEQAIIAKDQAELVLSKTSLKSPIKGVVISKYLSEGQLASTGTPVYKIGNIDKLKVLLPVSDYEISSWKIGNIVSVHLYDESINGQVTNIFSATNQSTGSINVEVTIDNANHKWHPGQVVTCNYNAASRTAIFVPKEAVISNGGSTPYVFLLKDNIAKKTDVEIGELKNNRLEIKSHINEDENIIIEGADKLSEGDEVRVLGSEE